MHEPPTLWSLLSASGALSNRALADASTRVTLTELTHGTSLGGGIEKLRDRSVLVATASQLATALAVIELDGVVRRLVVCPPDLPPAHVPFVVATGEIDAVVCDVAGPVPGLAGVETRVPGS